MVGDVRDQRMGKKYMPILTLVGPTSAERAELVTVLLHLYSWFHGHRSQIVISKTIPTDPP